MQILSNIKNLTIVLVIVYLMIEIKRSKDKIYDLKTQVEQTKNNLYQTNQVVAEMQKKIYNASIAYDE